MNDPDIELTWSAFAHHAKACSPCALLARHQHKSTAEPPYILLRACCEPGKELAEAWYRACRVRIEAFSDRFGPARA